MNEWISRNPYYRGIPAAVYYPPHTFIWAGEGPTLFLDRLKLRDDIREGISRLGPHEFLYIRDYDAD